MNNYTEYFPQLDDNEKFRYSVHMNIIRPVYAEVLITQYPIARFSTISSFTNIIIPLMMILGGFMCLAMLLLGAYRYLSSQGNPEKISKAQGVIIYAVIGLLIIVSSFVLTKIIGFVFNVKMPL